MKLNPQSQRWQKGKVVIIVRPSGRNTYACLMDFPLIAVYDIDVASEIEVSRLSTCDVLFYILVMKYSVTSGTWPITGKLASNSLPSCNPRFFKYDTIAKRFSITTSDPYTETLASREECLALECEAVWDPIHVGERLDDHYASRPNKWLDSLRKPLFNIDSTIF